MISETNQVLAQIRQYQTRLAESRGALQDHAHVADVRSPVSGADFSNLVGKAFAEGINGVSRLQASSDELIARFESGEDVPLTNVVLAMQKSSLAFEATIQVRNKVLKAYEDIMNMPV